MIDKIKEFGSVVLGCSFVFALIALPVLLLQGVLIISSKILPFFIDLSFWLTLVLITVLLPMALFKKTRAWSGLGFYIFSFIFGFTLWCYTAIITYYFWGLFALIIGLFIVGVGVLPIGFLASILNGEWVLLGNIIYLAVLTYGCRMFGPYLVEKAEKEAMLKDDHADVVVDYDQTSIQSEATIQGPFASKFCIDCDSEVGVNSNFCKYCGKQFN